MVALLQNLWTDNTPIVVRRGDLWQLGRHRLLCGDCTNAQDVVTLMQGETAKLGLHDPPYGLRSRMSWGFGDGKKVGLASRGLFFPVTGDDTPFEPQHLLASASIVIIWGANHFADKLPASPAWIVWDKRETRPSNDMSDVELAWVSTGNTARIIRHKWDGFDRASERGIPRIHPTQKPVHLFSELIRRYTAVDEVVTDWYGGSGTTLIAAENTKRRCYMMEIEPHYCQEIIKRWQNTACQQACKINSMTGVA